MQSKILDSTAIMVGAASAVLASIPAINNWLQMIVLLLTVVFLSLGIAMRVMKIRRETADDEED
ncbi:MAG TPA: hypothetical protein PLA50_00955 [Bacteroidia bacterium]|nr:hypothetical protein [Bacteroidia bacterium]